VLFVDSEFSNGEGKGAEGGRREQKQKAKGEMTAEKDPARTWKRVGFCEGGRYIAKKKIIRFGKGMSEETSRGMFEGKNVPKGEGPSKATIEKRANSEKKMTRKEKCYLTGRRVGGEI